MPEVMAGQDGGVLLIDALKDAGIILPNTVRSIQMLAGMDEVVTVHVEFILTRDILYRVCAHVAARMVGQRLTD